MLAINYNLFKSVVSAKMLRDFNASARTLVSSQQASVNAVIAREPKRPQQSPNQSAASPPAPRNDICFNKMYSMHGVIEMLRTLLISALVLALTGGPGYARDDAELEAVSQSSDATVIPNEAAFTDLPVAADADRSDDENTNSSAEEMQSKAGSDDADNALPANQDDAFPADTDAAASSGIQIDSMTQVEERSAEIESADEEPTESVTTTPTDASVAGDQDVTSEENREPVANTSSPGEVEFPNENAALSATDAGVDGKYATKEELNYVSNLVVDLQREIKSVKNSSVSESRFTEIQTALDAIRKELDALRSGKDEPSIPPQVTSEEEVTDDEQTVPEEEEAPEEVPPSPFTLVQDEDGMPLLQRKGQAASQHLQNLADAGECQKIGDWLEQTGIKLPKRAVFVQKNNRVAKCKQINSGKWKVYSSSASDTGYVVLPNGE
jgi:hypothetical protein